MLFREVMLFTVEVIKTSKLCGKMQLQWVVRTVATVL